MGSATVESHADYPPLCYFDNNAGQITYLFFNQDADASGNACDAEAMDGCLCTACPYEYLGQGNCPNVIQTAAGCKAAAVGLGLVPNTTSVGLVSSENGPRGCSREVTAL